MPPDPITHYKQQLTRRRFFGNTGTGLGIAALSSLLGISDLAPAATDSGTAHFPAKAKRVIYMFQNGAPTHVDLFDHKPGMEKFRDTQLPESVQQGKRLSTMTQGKAQKVLPSAWQYC